MNAPKTIAGNVTCNVGQEVEVPITTMPPMDEPEGTYVNGVVTIQ